MPTITHGIKTASAMTIIPELGKGLSAFKIFSNLVGRAGLRPRNDQSAGKIKSRITMHGNKFLRAPCTTRMNKLQKQEAPIRVIIYNSLVKSRATHCFLLFSFIFVPWQ
ncbi:MAG: IS110 family transposase [Prevotellaceae bacterium]|nr:IS110 family transposase [Prevotellaceae bacterium]